MKDIIKKISDIIQMSGNECVVNRKRTQEVIDFNFVIKDYHYILNEKDINYVNKKLEEINDNYELCVKRLKKDKNSRQAVIQFDVNKNIPNCIMSIQFIVRVNSLITIVSSRSLDVKNKLLCDIEIARRLSRRIMSLFDLRLEYIKFNVGSAHFYLE